MRQLTAVLILVLGAAVPAIFALVTAPPPQTRDIHIEAYRYGFSPSRIYVNRGDRLRLTFSTRDTGQSFFLPDYGLHVAITPGSRTEPVEIVAGAPGWLVSKSTFRNHTYNGPLHGTERGDLIVGPNLLLWAGFGLLCALPFLGLRQASERRFNLLAAFPWLKKVIKAPSFQFNLILPMLGVFWFIILAGLFGTKVAGRNAGPMIIWVLWLSALIIFLVPLGGRTWCTVCPLPVIGEWWQRRRLVDGISGLQWPSWLRNAWPRVLLFLLLGTFSTTLVAVPAATSWMLISLVVMATATAVFSEQRLFCRHICPINTYISLYSTTGRVMVRAVSEKACSDCSEHFCLTGSIKGWGCPYGLLAADLSRNNDCGACMECVKTCAYDNVAVFWRSSGHDEEVADYGEAWQAIVMFALACLYCYINLGAWDTVRDWIDIVDKKNWGTFAVYALAVWVVCLGVLPGLWYLLTRAGRPANSAAQFRATTAALIPIGLGCWIAFAIATTLSMMTFVLQSLSDPFGWGWNLLGMAGSPWHIYGSTAIPWMQVACVLVGAAYSLRTLRRCWTGAGWLPHASFLWLAAGGMIWFFAG